MAESAAVWNGGGPPLVLRRSSALLGNQIEQLSNDIGGIDLFTVSLKAGVGYPGLDIDEIARPDIFLDPLGLLLVEDGPLHPIGRSFLLPIGLPLSCATTPRTAKLRTPSHPPLREQQI